MEWMLQVVDEIDDAIGVLRHCWLGAAAEFPTFLAGGAGIGAAGATALQTGAEPVLVAAASAALGVAGFLKVLDSRLLPTP
jgi:hypothetical protein